MAAYPVDMSVAFTLNRSLCPGVRQIVAEIRSAVAHSLSAEPLSEQSIRLWRTAAELDIEDVWQSCKGDSEAYRRLIERHQEYIGRIMWRFSRDNRIHEELVQDVFVEAYVSLSSYRGKAPFTHWLACIATRVGYRYWKQMARQQKTETLSLEEWDRMAGQAERQSDLPAAERAGALIHNLLAHLPPRDRLVLTLRYIEGCSVAEAAQRTGWTQTLVKVQTLRARKKLKRLFESAYCGEGKR